MDDAKTQQNPTMMNMKRVGLTNKTELTKQKRTVKTQKQPGYQTLALGFHAHFLSSLFFSVKR
jgi:hypothetical protein